MLHNVLAMANSHVESVHVIASTLERSVSAAQVSLCQQELKYPVTVSPAQIQIFMTALGMGIASVEYVSARRYES